MNFNICTFKESEGHPAFTEICQSLWAGLTDLGHDAVIRHNFQDPTCYNIVVGPAFFEEYPSNAIYYNAEQPAKEQIITFPLIQKFLMERTIAIWDISPGVTKWWETQKLGAYHVPMSYTRAWLHNIERANPKYDFCFFGYFSERRQNITRTLAKKGYTCLLGETIFGRARAQAMAQCRFTLNLHAREDTTIFERARVLPALVNGNKVISEKCEEPDHLPGLMYAYDTEAIIELLNQEHLSNFSELSIERLETRRPRELELLSHAIKELPPCI